MSVHSGASKSLAPDETSGLAIAIEPPQAHLPTLELQPELRPEPGTIHRRSANDFVICLNGQRFSAEFQHAKSFAMACPRYEELQLETTADMCMRELACRPTQHFRLVFEPLENRGLGDVMLSVDACVVEKIPLLKHVLLQSRHSNSSGSETGSGEQGPTDEDEGAESPDAVRFDPPGSLWAVVSVLMLLEEVVTVPEWLGGHGVDTTLPSQTLVVRFSPSLYVQSIIANVVEACTNIMQ